MLTNIPKFDVAAGEEFPKKVIPLLEKAERSIDIIVFDWRWYPDDIGASIQKFNRAIFRASERGVKVRAISNVTEIIRQLKGSKIKIKKLTSPKLVHIKMLIIDKETIVIGSHNYTKSAFERNYELSVILNKVDADNRFVNFFNSIYD